jgi:hypothetical protein
MRTLPLSRGYEALVDDEGYARASKFKWCAKVARRKDGSIENVYALRTVYRDGKKTTENLHRFIMSVSEPAIEVDHRDGDGLNCLRSNLRICSHTENVRNQRLNVDNTSGLKGVSLRKQSGKFYAQIMVGGRKKFLGSFVTRELAALRYDEASIKFHGAYGLTNAALGLLKKKPVTISIQLELELSA